MRKLEKHQGAHLLHGELFQHVSAIDGPPADAMAASQLRAAADTMPPKAPQVQVSTQISIDAADYLPLGDVTQEEHPADTEATSKLKTAADKDEKHQAGGMAASEPQPAADPWQPRALQVQDSTGKANDAAVHSPLGYVAIGDHPVHAETASKLQAAAEKVEKHQAEEMAASELWATADTLQYS